MVRTMKLHIILGDERLWCDTCLTTAALRIYNMGTETVTPIGIICVRCQIDKARERNGPTM